MTHDADHYNSDEIVDEIDDQVVEIIDHQTISEFCSFYNEEQKDECLNSLSFPNIPVDIKIHDLCHNIFRND